MSLTAQFYAGDTDKLWTNPITGGTHTGTPTNGGLVGIWQDEATPATRNIIWSGGAGATSLHPSFATPGSMLLPCLSFDGGDRYLAIDNGLYTFKPLSAFVSSTNKTLIFAIRLTAGGTNNANMYDNTGIFADSNGYFGLHLKTVAGVHTIYGYNWDGNSDSAGVTVSLNTDYVVMVRHNGTTLYLSVLSGTAGGTRSDASTASGTTSQVTATAKLGVNYSNSYCFTGYIGEMYCDNSDLGATNTPLSDIVGRWLPASTSNRRRRVLLGAC